MFHEDLEVDIADQSGDSPQTVSGGKEEFCDLTKATVAGLQLVPHSHERGLHRRERETGLAASLDWRSELPREPHASASLAPTSRCAP